MIRPAGGDPDEDEDKGSHEPLHAQRGRQGLCVGTQRGSDPTQGQEDLEGVGTLQPGRFAHGEGTPSS